MLFNIAGYRYVFNYLEDSASAKLDKAIDAGDYAEDNLIEITVPLNMPYQTRTTEFERQYGEITVEGRLYKYVKMKVDGDKLVLKCIANNNKQHLRNSAVNVAKSATGQDMENNGKKHTNSLAKVFSTDYDDKNNFDYAIFHQSAVKQQVTLYAAALQDVLIKIPHQPPKC